VAIALLASSIAASVMTEAEFSLGDEILPDA
jgi:hypothetical protein